MHGHDHLIAMRMRGVAPKHGVMVETDEGRRAYINDLNDCSLSVWHVAIAPSERLHMLDLRPFTGLQVFVNGLDAGRVAAVSAAIDGAGAHRVVASVFRWIGQRAHLVTVTDTLGVMQWPQ